MSPVSQRSAPPSPLPFSSSGCCDEEAKSPLTDYRFSDPTSIDYIVMPIPANASLIQDNSTVTSRITSIPDSSSNFTSHTTRRRSSSPVLIRQPNITKSSSSHSHHHEQAGKESSSWCENAPFAKIKAKRHSYSDTQQSLASPQQKSNLSLDITTSATTPHNLQEYCFSSQSRNQLDFAMANYENRVQCFFSQLVNGCGRSWCTNQFCATGYGHRFASVSRSAIMAFAAYLASQPGAQCCVTQPSFEKVPYQNRDKDSSIKGRYFSQPFLRTLMGVAPFSTMFDSQSPEEHEDESQADQTISSNSTSPSSGWHFDLPRMMRFIRRQLGLTEAINQDDDEWTPTPPKKSNDNQIEEIRTGSSPCLGSPTDYRQIIKPIQLQEAMALVRSFANHQDHVQLRYWLGILLSSPDLIGNSFLDDHLEVASCLPERIQRVSLDNLGTFLDALFEMDQTQSSVGIQRTVTEGFEILLQHLCLNLQHLLNDDTHTLTWCRAILCVCKWIECYNIGMSHSSGENDLHGRSETAMKAFSNPTHLSVVTESLVQLLSSIESPHRGNVYHTIIYLLQSSGENLLLHLVQHFQASLRVYFQESASTDSKMARTAKCLHLLYSVSNDSTFNLVPKSVFYDQALCDKLNFWDEYRIWQQMTRQEGINMDGAVDQESSILFSWLNFPFMLPPVTKRQIMQIDAFSNMSCEYRDALANHSLVLRMQRLLIDHPQMIDRIQTQLKNVTYPYFLLDIRREHFVADTWKQVALKWPDLKKPMRVRFTEGGEDGMDQGGVQKEFFGILFEHLLGPDMGLFINDPETRLYWFRPSLEPDVRAYEMVGVMIGLAIYNGVMINLPFPFVFWKALLMPNEEKLDAAADELLLFSFDDLKQGWPTLAHGLELLLDYPGDVEDVFSLSYEISVDVFEHGGPITYPLIPHGETIPVTNANRVDYCEKYCTFIMYKLHRDALRAVRRGIRAVIGDGPMSLCTPDELCMVACGKIDGDLSQGLDLTELEAVAGYDDGYSPEHPVICRFWSIIHNDLTDEQRAKFLWFVTACDRIPIGGFKELTIVIQRNGPDSDRLPTALTCFSRLLLPEYATRETLHDRLVTAIENAKGFGLV